MDRIRRANTPPTDAPIATAMVESLGGGTEKRAGLNQLHTNNKRKLAKSFANFRVEISKYYH